MLVRAIKPEIKQFPDVRIEIPRQEVMDNGMGYAVVNYGDVDVCQMDVYVGGGSFGQGKNCLSYFVASLLKKGSENYSSEEIAEIFDFYGAVFSTAVMSNSMRFSIKSINKNFKCVLPVFYDCLTHPAYEQKELDIAREKFLADTAIRHEQVGYLAAEKMSELVYGKGHPLSIAVDAETVKGIATDELKEFHDKYFAPGNCSVVLSGKVTDEEIELFKSIFGKWEPRRFDEPVAWYREPGDSSFEIVQKDDAVQTAIEISIDAIPRDHEDYIKLRILTSVLGGYFGSRLMMNIREDKGYTYGIGSYLQGLKHMGRIGISTECGSQYTGEVLKEVKKEIDRLKTELIPEEELQVVRNHILSDLVKTLDNAFSIAGYVGLVYGFDVYPEYFNEQVRQVKAVTPEELNEVAKKYLLDDKMKIVLAGDKNKMKLES